jgi:predicted amidohydrolase
VFPELAFTTFFPRWLLEGAALDHYFERGMPNPNVAALFDRARALRVGFYVGYAELTPDGRRYNCAVLVDRDGELLGRYRKVHLPGSVEPRQGARYQQLEKRYFDYGDLGFPAFRAGSAWAHARASSSSASATIRRPMIPMAAARKMPPCAPSTPRW